MLISEITHEMIKDNVIICPEENRQPWSASGYLVAKCPDGEYVIGKYAHCSCYGTWSREGPCLLWKGTWKALVTLAVRRADPEIPERMADNDDYDLHEVQNLYRDVLKKEEENNDSILSKPS